MHFAPVIVARVDSVTLAPENPYSWAANSAFSC